MNVRERAFRILFAFWHFCQSCNRLKSSKYDNLIGGGGHSRMNSSRINVQILGDLLAIFFREGKGAKCYIIKIQFRGDKTYIFGHFFPLNLVPSPFFNVFSHFFSLCVRSKSFFYMKNVLFYVIRRVMKHNFDYNLTLWSTLFSSSSFSKSQNGPAVTDKIRYIHIKIVLLYNRKKNHLGK